MQCSKVYGALYAKDKTIFTLWAPDARQVLLRFYAAGSGEEAPMTTAHHRLTKDSDGVFSCAVKGDLHGVYYDYQLTFADGKTCESADPWAKACGLNGVRSMVIDLDRTDPAGWSVDQFTPAEAAPVVYETHVKDFSWDPESGVRPEWRGRFLGFTQEATSHADVPTCLQHLKHLGITHVQLQPIADFASVREDRSTDYNWGYDIMNYNVPEGSYATDAAHGEVRIRECKQMIQALHKAGIGVILDVVYNHTYHQHSWLDRTAPGRYYRHGADGAHLNGSGCGNETASENPAFRNYMVQSILYWATEYHIDGFRFDLMGVHDTETMNAIRAALDELPNGKSILLYGEPWAGGAIALKSPCMPADKAHVKELGSRVGLFSDTTRDTLMGSPFDAALPGFAAGKTDASATAALRECLRGLPNELSAPSQAVHYVSCHDNQTLWDHLVFQTSSRDFDGFPGLLIRRMRFVSALYLFCLGIGFIQEGEEFCRTKHGDGNSYQGPAQVNALYWQKAAERADLVSWYRGLIGLRR